MQVISLINIFARNVEQNMALILKMIVESANSALIIQVMGEKENEKNRVYII